MKLFLIGRFLTILALAGLMLAPIGSAMAMPMPSAPTQAMAGMAEKMDCCPEHQSKVPSRAKPCPFVALCMTSLTGFPVTEAVAFHVRDLVGVRLLPASGFALASLDGEPPSRPPRV